MAAVGERRKAPTFTLEDGTGKRVSLEDFRGRDVVVPLLSEGQHARLLEAVRGE